MTQSEWEAGLRQLRSQRPMSGSPMRLRWWSRIGPSESALRGDEARLWAALFPLDAADRAKPELVFPVRDDRLPDGWTQGMEVEVLGHARPGGAALVAAGDREMWPAGPLRPSAIGSPRWDAGSVGSTETPKSAGVRFWPILEDRRPWVHVAAWALFGVVILLQLVGDTLGLAWVLLVGSAVIGMEVWLRRNTRRYLDGGQGDS